MGLLWIRKKFLNASFRIHNFLEKNSKPVIAIITITSIGLLWYIPVLYGAALIGIAAIFLLGTFDLHNPRKSLVNLCIFLFVMMVILSPIIGLTVREKYRVNHPARLINREHPKIQAMTKEFQSNLPENAATSTVLDRLEKYVYGEIPYECSLAASFFPTTDEVMKKMSSDCRGRALVGYAILKNIGYDVYIVVNLVNHHAWLRVYEDESYSETFVFSRSPKAWVKFNESGAHWNSPTDELSRIFSKGSKIHNMSELFLLSIAVAIPIGVSAIYILVSKKNRKLKIYFSAGGGALAVAAVSNYASKAAGEKLILPLIIVTGGLYLRACNDLTQ